MRHQRHNACVIIATILSTLLFRCQPAKVNDPLPNVVFILADDLGYGDLSCFGQTKFRTPNIDALAAGGLVFTQHYSGSTVCAPSRSALLTGFHTGHTFIRGNKEVLPEGQYPLPDSIVTLAEMFKSKGYSTGIFGKWGLGFPGSSGDPLNQGFDSFMGYNCQRLAHNYYPFHLWHNHEKVLIPENQGTNTGVFAPEEIQKHALGFIDANREKSFFLFLPSIMPHAELAAPASYLQKYSGKLGEEKPFNGPEPSDKTFKTGGYSSQREPHAAFAAMVNLLDDHVGQVVKKLKELNLYDNTIIVFTSDNGPHQEGGADPDYFDSNGPLRGYKRDLYEGGIRVPMIVHWPAKILPGRTNHMSAFWDFMATFSELVGAEPPRDSDGLSFVPTLFGQPDRQKSHPYLYWEFHEQGGKQAVRKGKWKALRLNVNGEKSKFELYNLEDDPSEEHDLSEVYGDSVREMNVLMQSAHTTNPVFKFGNR